MPARRRHKKTTPHGGVVPILQKIQELGVPQCIRESLGKRRHNSKFGYDDVFITWVLASLCGAKKLQHVDRLKGKLSAIPDLKIPSHDTMGRVFKKLGTEVRTKRNISKKGKGKISHTKVNDHITLNELLLIITIKMGLLTPGVLYNIDIDASFITTRCFDAERGGKHNKLGYAPMVCFIGNLPIFISLRSGNASAAFEIAQCMQECIALLEKYGIKTGRVVSDGAGQSKELLEFLDSKNIKFNVKKPMMSNNRALISGLLNSEWHDTEIRTTTSVWECEITSFPYKMHKSEMQTRIVCLRVPDKDTIKKLQSEEERERREWVKNKLSAADRKHRLKKMGKAAAGHGQWVNYKGYDYKIIITNDLTSDPKKLMLEYNKRGGSERNFDYMKNEFNWKWPPFMHMAQNTVFLIAAAMANNLWRGTVRIFKKDIPQINERMRFSTFKFIFIDVVFELIDGIYEYDNTDIDFEKIM